MNDWLRQHHALIWWLVGVSAATFAATLVAVPVFVVRLPADYFATNRKAPRRDRHPVVHLAIAIVRNVVGYVFIVVGVAMLILPGQGILTILAGLGLVDFPGKHRLMRLIVKRKPVRKSLDWIRERGGKPKFQLDPAE